MCTSRWLVGSSRISTSGAWISTLAMASRFCCPPLKVFTGCSISRRPKRCSSTCTCASKSHAFSSVIRSMACLHRFALRVAGHGMFVGTHRVGHGVVLVQHLVHQAVRGGHVDALVQVADAQALVEGDDALHPVFPAQRCTSAGCSSRCRYAPRWPSSGPSPGRRRCW